MKPICQEKTGVEEPAHWNEKGSLPNSFAPVGGQDLSKETGNVLWGSWERTPPRIISWLVESSWALSWLLRSWIRGCPSVVLRGVLKQWTGTLEICPVLWWLSHLGHKQQLKSSMSLFCSPEVESRVFDFHYLSKNPYSFEISMLFDYYSLCSLSHHW